MSQPPPEVTDHDLLRAYAAGGDQDAFTRLVRRHVDMVYAAARRQVGGDAHLAHDVTQAVFLLLAEKARAGRIGPRVVIPGWLYTATRYAAANARRADRHRRRHERNAALLTPTQTPAAMTDDDSRPAWAQLAPHLDAALSRLAATDRNAVLLKYIQGRSHQDVGQALGISEEAARKRVSRALERLRHLLLRRDVALPAATLATLLTTHATEAAPAVLTTACVVAPPAATAALAKSTLSTLAWIKVKVAATFLLAASVVSTTAALGVRHFTPVARHPAPLPATPVLALADPAPPAPPAPAPGLSKIDAVLRTPDDAPAAGAEVYVVMPEDPAVAAEHRAWQAKIMAGQRNVPPPPRRKETAVSVYDAAWPDGTVTTDATGHFSFADLKEPWILVARHETGYLQLTHEQFKKATPGDVYLQPWGKVEGTLRVGKEPQVNQKVILFRSGTADDWQAMRVQHNRTATTDPEGHFVFDHVAPGESWVAWEPKVKNPLRRIRHTLADVEPGKTLTLDIGGTGRPVIGRAAVVPTNAPGQKLRWIDDHRGQSVSAMYNHTAGTTGWKTPPNWAHMTRQQQIAWQKAWEQTPEGKERKRHQWAEDLDLNPDGSFRIDDLVPGTYHVQIRMFHDENGFGEDLVDAGTEFTVPPLPAGQTRSDEPLDLGTIPVTLKPRALVGQVAPDFEVKTLDGKPVKLSDFRGKYVLLKWFWSWCDLGTEIPPIQQAYDMIKDDPNWVLITIDFDQPLDVAKQRVADHHIPGLHTTATQESKAFPRAYLGSPSTLIFIGPDGKVLARNLHPENAPTEVAKIRLEHQ